MTLSRLLGTEPPKVPAGGRAYVSLDGGRWSVRVDTGEGKGERLGPPFILQTTAYAYLDWITGAAGSFEYPEGAA